MEEERFEELAKRLSKEIVGVVKEESNGVIIRNLERVMDDYHQLQIRRSVLIAGINDYVSIRNKER